ncbi:hypothetical protein Tco_1270351 [Tanacetum coccineum]
MASQETQETQDQPPLWEYVTKLENQGAAGGVWKFQCNLCSETRQGSYSRVRAHLLGIKDVRFSVYISCRWNPNLISSSSTKTESVEMSLVAGKVLTVPTTSRAQDLVYIHNNLRLLSRNPNDDVKMWDVGVDAFDSMEDVPLEDVVFLEHVRETTTITSTQNTNGIVQVEEVEEVEEKPVRIIPGLAGIVQLAKIRKQLDIHEGGDDFVLSTQEYMKQVVEDVGEDEDYNSGAWVGATEYVKASGGISCSPNALGDLKVTVKDLSGTLAGSIHYKVFNKDFVTGNGSGVGGSGMLMEEEEIVKLVKEEEMADLELHVCGNVIDQEDLYKFDEEALDLVLEEEARESKAHEEWLEKCRQQEKEDVEHERQLLGFHGTI